MPSTINLLRPVESTSTQLITIKEEARRIAFIAFIASLFIGILVLLIYIIARTALASSTSTNTKLMKQLDEQKVKEQMLAVVKGRIQVVTKAMEYSKPVDKALSYANQIAGVPSLSIFSYSDDGKVTVVYKSSSIEETLQMSEIIQTLVERKEIRNARIVTFGIDKDSTRITFSFYPTWNTP